MARILDDILGHQHQISSLLEMISRNRLPQTFLFTGPEGIGKKKIALALTQILTCQNPTQDSDGESLACGKCSNCIEISKEESHLLLLLAPEKKNSFIKIEQSRHIFDFTRLQIQGRQPRVIIIDGADFLNPQAANALLKILEDPPKKTYFILIASHLGRVLPTIRSRSQIVSFSPLPPSILKQKINAPNWMIASSGGSLSKLEIMVEQSWSELRQVAMDFVSAAYNNDGDYFHKLNNVVKDRETTLFIGYWLQTILRDGLWAKTHQEGWINGDCQSMIKCLTALESKQLIDMADETKQLERGIHANYDKLLLFEKLWYFYRDIFKANVFKAKPVNT